MRSSGDIPSRSLPAWRKFDKLAPTHTPDPSRPGGKVLTLTNQRGGIFFKIWH